MSPSTASTSLSAVTGSNTDLVPIKRVLVSVFDKTGIVDFCSFLVKSYPEIQLLSTGGTAKALRESGLTVLDVSDYTGSTECLDGRVKTLHPKIHGGLLAVRGNVQHEQDMMTHNIQCIDMTIVNLYPFEQTINTVNITYEQCIENIDIGGPSMIRSTAKNHVYTTVITSPSHYKLVQDILTSTNGCTTLAVRKYLAAAAFAVSAQYDSMIASYLHEQLLLESKQVQVASSVLPTLPAPVVTRVYQPEFPLKYGCNPHQHPAGILSRMGHTLPFTVLNGTPGYINLLDACNAYQLVVELKDATSLSAAASFKHVSPAGAAVAVPLTDIECLAYDVDEKTRTSLTPVSLAYLRARNADPMCSYGDFCAVSDIVDEVTATFLKTQVSDGIIAPGYTETALTILQKKKGGKFIVLQATTSTSSSSSSSSNYNPGEFEYREVYGLAFCQKRNHIKITPELISSNVVTTSTATTKTETGTDNVGGGNVGTDGVLPESAIRDLLVATICIKYTQSNSVGFSINGQMIGVGAGQQSRVDCVKLAGRKVMTWFLRQHPKVLSLPFASSTKRQDRINARVRYIEGDFTIQEKEQWDTLFDGTSPPELFTDSEKYQYLQTCSGVSISSDAFFPFRDSIDFASKYGVSYVAQPGGSVQDQDVIAACNTYKMAMTFTNTRLFHH